MAIDTIKSSAVLDGAIATADIASNAVTTAKIVDNAVTTAKITDANITTAKIADDAVTSAKLDTNIAIDGKLGIGDSTVLGNKVHIRTGGSATSVNASAGLVLEDDDNTRCDLQFMGPDGAFHSILFGDVSDNDIGKISYSHSGNNMRFTVNAAERMRLTADGLTFNGDTAAANALDDYEEGTWTPVFAASSGNPTVSYGAQNGTYTKIGRYVYTTFFVQINSVSSQGSGNLRIGPLPFALTTAHGYAVENGATFYEMGGLGRTINAGTGRGIGTDQILLTNMSTGGGAQSLNTGALTGGYVIGSYMYITDV